MAKESMPRSLSLDMVPFAVVVLLAAHVIALVYWIYRLATDKQTPRRKEH